MKIQSKENKWLPVGPLQSLQHHPFLQTFITQLLSKGIVKRDKEYFVWSIYDDWVCVSLSDCDFDFDLELKSVQGQIQIEDLEIVKPLIPYSDFIPFLHPHTTVSDEEYDLLNDLVLLYQVDTQSQGNTQNNYILNTTPDTAKHIIQRTSSRHSLPLFYIHLGSFLDSNPSKSNTKSIIDKCNINKCLLYIDGLELVDSNLWKDILDIEDLNCSAFSVSCYDSVQTLPSFFKSFRMLDLPVYTKPILKKVESTGNPVYKKLSTLLTFAQSPYRPLGIQPPKGILVTGAPGCGKSHVILTLLKDLQLEYITLTPSKVFSKYTGSSSANLVHIFNQASKSNSVLYIPNLNPFGSRSETNGVFTTLLNLLDGIEMSTVLVLGECNGLCEVDSALMRAGRFEVVYMGLPSLEERMGFLQLMFTKLELEFDLVECDFSEMSNRTEGFSFADLEFVKREIVYHKMENKVTMGKVLEIIDGIRGLSQGEDERFEQFK